MKLTARYTGISSNLETELFYQLFSAPRRLTALSWDRDIYHAGQDHDARIFLFTAVYNSRRVPEVISKRILMEATSCGIE